jgi:hypothetical protein
VVAVDHACPLPCQLLTSVDESVQPVCLWVSAWIPGVMQKLKQTQQLHVKCICRRCSWCEHYA